MLRIRFKHLVGRLLLAGLALVLILALVVAGATWRGLGSAPESFQAVLAESSHYQMLDRHGEPLNITYQNQWNVHDQVALYQVPEFLQQALMAAEDQRFYQHGGVDWWARWAAVWANLRALRAVRGASTITEQVVRMIHPRPRTLWSRWLEGFEAAQLEQGFSKAEILEFYLNQVPYAANRRGVNQAARYYFDRDLSTLSQKEMLALVVLVRSPSRLDLWKGTGSVDGRIARVAQQLVKQQVLSQQQLAPLLEQTLELQHHQLDVNAVEFIQAMKREPALNEFTTRQLAAGSAGSHWNNQLTTTLDAGLQARLQTLLDQRLTHLAPRRVHNGAVLAVDHRSGEILAWVVAGKGGGQDTPGRNIDAVTTPRQPGSALKPFLYALALSKGWTAATVIDDAPLSEAVGNGLHAYQNYSRSFYGPVTLRQALGNSLNIPALKALQFVGSEDYLSLLARLGFAGLRNHPNFYGDGIALGNGEVTLLELVQAYTVLANSGLLRPLSGLHGGLTAQPTRRVLDAPVASLIGHILSDSSARELEFGSDSVLNLPLQTAVKTGTSSDYRDSWAVGFNYRYTVGVWMGNLDQQATDGITGSTGPALVLRAVFNELTRHQQTQPLRLDPALSRHDLCLASHRLKQADEECESYTEWFIAGSEPQATAQLAEAEAPRIRLRQPAFGLHIAMDPRVPAERQAFEFLIQGVAADDRVVWRLDGHEFSSHGPTYHWPLQQGRHELSAQVWRGEQTIAQLEPSWFVVK